MKELGEIFQSIFNKISDFFDILDLSSLVSGITVNTAVMIYLDRWGIYSFQDICTTRHIVLAVIFCYISGLLMLAGGNWLHCILQYIVRLFSKKNWRTAEELMYGFLEANALENHPLFAHAFTQYRQDPASGALQALYIKLCAIVREDKKYKKSDSLLQRYWVMSATYNGLAMAVFTVFLLAVIDLYHQALPLYRSPSHCFYLCILLPTVFLCIREAHSFRKSQIEETIATVII